jgi:hypothetical protein
MPRGYKDLDSRASGGPVREVVPYLHLITDNVVRCRVLFPCQNLVEQRVPGEPLEAAQRNASPQHGPVVYAVATSSSR